ncbi:hypothetical protein DFH09DRAFT_620453 [Mycena vulgaris]|nr:hypothetical protein DFH09DRAFT_620453 [Mycena vulgaris]
MVDGNSTVAPSRSRLWLASILNPALDADSIDLPAHPRARARARPAAASATPNPSPPSAPHFCPSSTAFAIRRRCPPSTTPSAHRGRRLTATGVLPSSHGGIAGLTTAVCRAMEAGGDRTLPAPRALFPSASNRARSTCTSFDLAKPRACDPTRTRAYTCSCSTRHRPPHRAPPGDPFPTSRLRRARPPAAPPVGAARKGRVGAPTAPRSAAGLRTARIPFP